MPLHLLTATYSIISGMRVKSLEYTFNQARFIIRQNDIDDDFDIDVKIIPNNDWKAHYYNKKLTLSILDINSKPF